MIRLPIAAIASRQVGFTLIELMAVMRILAIVTAAAAPAVSGRFAIALPPGRRGKRSSLAVSA
jgi:prepilin-type N-terminal cleavage/methylation domain-containing protein